MFFVASAHYTILVKNDDARTVSVTYWDWLKSRNHNSSILRGIFPSVGKTCINNRMQDVSFAEVPEPFLQHLQEKGIQFTVTGTCPPR